jgi:ubiquinone/menaquinone biosynthesis C-methylase UbiE/uncharacterized protein YbaR (Trm112 family)
MNKKTIIDFIECPICKIELKLKEGVLFCSNCNRKYFINNSIPILIPENGESWVEQTRKDMVTFDNYFKKRIDKNNGWWLSENIDKYEGVQKKYIFNIARLKVIDFLGKNVQKNSLLVDFGGGEGYVGDTIQSKYYKKEFIIIEQDISNLLQIYGIKKHKANKEKMFFLTSDIAHNGIKSNIANAIFSTESIEHVRNVDIFIKEMKRILKKDGYLLITTPNNEAIPSKIEHYSRKIFYGIKNYFTKNKKKIIFHNKITDSEEGYEKILTYKDIKKILKDNNLVVCSHECTQFLGDLFFDLSRRIKLPLFIVKFIIKITKPFEKMFGKFLIISSKLGCTQIIICKKMK